MLDGLATTVPGVAPRSPVIASEVDRTLSLLEPVGAWLQDTHAPFHGISGTAQPPGHLAQGIDVFLVIGQALPAHPVLLDQGRVCAPCTVVDNMFFLVKLALEWIEGV